MSMSMSMVEAAKLLAEKGQEMLRKRDFASELRKSRLQERIAMDRRHEWQFLWVVMESDLGALNPWKADTVPEEFRPNTAWSFDLKPFGKVPISIIFLQDSDRLWFFHSIRYPTSVNAKTLEFQGFCRAETNDMPMVLANILAMEKRIAENTSDHA